MVKYMRPFPSPTITLNARRLKDYSEKSEKEKTAEYTHKMYSFFM